MEAYVRRKKNQKNHVLGFSEFRLIGKKNFLGVLGSSFETLAACQTIGAPTFAEAFQDPAHEKRPVALLVSFSKLHRQLSKSTVFTAVENSQLVHRC